MIGRAFRLEAEQIYLRFPKRSDFAEWRRIRNRDRAHLMPWEPLWASDANSRREWRQRMEGWKRARREGTGYGFLVFSRMGERLLGGIALTHVRQGSARTGTLGYWLSAEAQGHGFMSQAVKRICIFGETELGLKRIEAATMVDNTRSQSVLERCGFEREGLARSYLQIAGARRDHILFGRVSDSETIYSGTIYGETDEQGSREN